MKNAYFDIIIGAAMVAGVLGFVSGEFILSSVFFALATIAGNIRPKIEGAKGRI